MKVYAAGQQGKRVPLGDKPEYTTEEVYTKLHPRGVLV